MNDDPREQNLLTNSKSATGINWSKRPLTRTKPVDSFSELCQQLTNVVAQQTALSDKLIEAFREAKDNNNNQTNTNRLSAPNLEALRYTPSPDGIEESSKWASINPHIIVEGDKFNGEKQKMWNLESFNLVVTNIDTIRSCMATVMNEMRLVITGQIPLESQPNTLTNIFAVLSIINSNCNNCKSGLNGMERNMRSPEMPRKGSMKYGDTSEKGTQTLESTDTSESDPDDKDSGLESNSGGRPSESNGPDDFQIYTEYDQLMESSIPQDITNKKPRYVLKDKMISCPGPVLIPKIIKSGTCDESSVMKLGSMESTEDALGSLDDDVITTGSQYTISDVFTSHEPKSIKSIPLVSIGSVEGDEESDTHKMVLLQSISVRNNRKRFQRSKTIDTSKIAFDDEVDTSLNSSNQSSKNEKEGDFEILEKEVNYIKFHSSTSSYSSQSRKDALKSLVIGTRKQVSNEIKQLVHKLTQHRRKSKGSLEEVTVEEMVRAVGERIDQLMQTSEYFGAILHEIHHSHEKENLISYIDMIKTLHRPNSFPSNGTFPRTDSNPSSDTNDRSRCVSPTATVFGSYKTIESSYQRGFNEGVGYMRDEFEEELEKNKTYVQRFDTVTDQINLVVKSEMKGKYNFLYGTGTYFALIAAISFLFMFIF